MPFAGEREAKTVSASDLSLKEWFFTRTSAVASALAVLAVLLIAAYGLGEWPLSTGAVRLVNASPQALDEIRRLAVFVLIALSASAVAALLFLRYSAGHSKERARLVEANGDAAQQIDQLSSELATTAETFRALFDLSAEAYFLLDDAKIVDCNESAISMLRAEKKEQILGRSLKEFAPHAQPGGESSSAFLERCRELARKQGKYRFNCVYSRFDGTDLYVNAGLTSIPLRGETFTLVAWHDLTERREAEEALLRSAARLRVAQAIAHLGHWEYDSRTDRVFWSEEALRIFGFASPTDSPTLQNCFHRIHPEDRASAELAFAAAIRRGKPIEIYFRILLPDGNIRHVDSRSRSDHGSSGKAGRVSGTILDITEQKQVEARLRQTLAEKELLVKEVHHRVKNNLQVVSSLLSMQIDLLEDEDSIQSLRESQHRISSMALIHERLYSHGNIDNVDFAEYAETLVQELFHAYGKQAQYIYKNLDLAPVPLNIEKAIPCGLILNELVTNALKHAFPSGHGTLNVTLQKKSKDRLSLCVSDTGIGLPADLDLRDAKSLGLPLVEVLARQLGGVLDVQSKPGATFTVEFPSGVI